MFFAFLVFSPFHLPHLVSCASLTVVNGYFSRLSVVTIVLEKSDIFKEYECVNV